MNTLLNIGNIALQYYRGKQTGLAGLGAILVSILIVAFWDFIAPVFRVTGISSFLQDIGLVTPGDGAMNVFKILVAIVALYFLLLITVFPVLFIFGMLSLFFSTKLGKTVLKAALFIFFSPLLILFFFFTYIMILIKGKPSQEQAPRLTEDEIIIRKLSSDGCEDGETNIITTDIARNYLNRLPTIGDNFFLVGERADGKLYALLPRPFGMLIYGDVHDNIFCKEISVKLFNKDKDKISYFERTPINYRIHIDVNSNENIIDLEEIDIDSFTKIIKVSNIPDLLYAFSVYMSYSPYKKYVNIVQTHFFKGMDKIKYELGNELEGNPYSKLINELNIFENIPNQTVVRYIWEGERANNTELS